MSNQPTNALFDDQSEFLEKLNRALDQNDISAAFRICKKAIECDAENADAHRHLGMLYAAAGESETAEQEAKQACRLAPNDARVWSDLGKVYGLAGEVERAILSFNKAVIVDAGFADGWHNLGTACAKLGQNDGAFNAFRKALLIEPHRSETYMSLGTLLTKNGQFEDALECFERAIRHDPDLASARSRLAKELAKRGKVKRADILFRQSLVMDPNLLEGWLGLAGVLEDMGEAQAALAAYEKALELAPDNPIALGSYAALSSDNASPDHLAHAQRLIASDATKHEAKALIGYGLAKHHSRQRNYRAAADAGLIANAARRSSAGPLDRDRFVERVDAIIETYSPAFFSQYEHLGADTDAPVFIVGLPRSGTTLTEQIISAHPDLHGAGELPDLGRLAARVVGSKKGLWNAAARVAELGPDTVEEVAAAYLKAMRDGAPKGSARISDKSPLNLFQLAFAAVLFPKARVIHCSRDPRDTALSIWLENFSPDQQWSTDFDDLAFYHRHYLRLMQHWRTALPLPMLELRYEDTVSDLEGQARRIIEHLGVSWSDKCLDFHKSDRAVQTPSRWQVRQPIYTRSVERWRHYAQYLPGLQTLDEFDTHLNRSAKES